MKSGSLKENIYKLKENRRIKLLLKIGLIALLFSFSYLWLFKAQLVKSNAPTQLNVRIDYLEELAYLTSTNGSYKFYMSTDNKRNWDVLETGGVVDISTILSSKPVTVYFKGNKDTYPTEIILDGEDSTLQVKYEILNGSGRITYSATSLVEYRKGNNGAWKPAYNNITTSIYEVRGATLSFRTAATTVKRAGKVVNVKIPKRPAAPSVKVDGGKLYITGIKPGATEYRIGDSTTWIPYTSSDPKIKTIDLRTLLLPGSVMNTVLPAATLEFRTIGTEKKLTSSVKVIEIPQQTIVPDSVALVGTTLSVVDTNTKRAYEYTRVEGNNVLNLSTARWTTFTSKKSVIVPKAAVGDRIYVRLKATTDSATKQTILASTYKELPVQSITTK